MPLDDNHNNFHTEDKHEGFIERIDKTKLRPLNDPSCQHLNITKTPADDMPGYIDNHCTDCHRGWFTK